jgi:hypothetical protein
MSVPEGNEAAVRDDDLRRHVAAELFWSAPGVTQVDDRIRVESSQ